MEGYMGQPTDLQDRLFCEAGSDIGLLTQENIKVAVEKQNTDRAIGLNKPIGAYFVEAQILSRDQIGQILKIQNKYANAVGALQTEAQAKVGAFSELEKNPSNSFSSAKSHGQNAWSFQTFVVLIAIVVFALLMGGAYQGGKGSSPIAAEKEQETSSTTYNSGSATPKKDLSEESFIDGKNVLCDDTAIVFCLNITTIYAQFIEKVRNLTALDKAWLAQLFSAIPEFTKARAQAKVDACFANMRVILGATEIYNMDNSTMLTGVDIPRLISGSYLKSPIIYPDPKCSYSAIGDLSGTGVVFCSLHGSLEHPLPSSIIEPTNNEALSGDRINEIRDSILTFDSTECFKPTGFLWASISSDMATHIILEASIKPLEFFSFLQRLDASIPKPITKSKELVVIRLPPKGDFQCRIMPTGIEILLVQKEFKPNVQAWADLLEAIKEPETILALEVDGLRAQQIQGNQSIPVWNYFRKALLYLNKSKIQIKSIPPDGKNLDSEKTSAEFIISNAKSAIVSQLKAIEAPHIQFVQNLLDNIVVSKSPPWLELSLEGLDANPIFANRGWFDIANALAIENMKQARAMAQKKACFANIRVILGAIEMYNMDHSEMLTYVDIPRLVSGSYLKSGIQLPTPNCSYSHRGDLTEDGVVCCSFHGAPGDVNTTINDPKQNHGRTTQALLAVLTQDQAAVQTVVDQLYSVALKSGATPEPVKFQNLLTPNLYSLICYRYNDWQSEDYHDSPAYCDIFFPGQDPGDKFEVQPSEVNDRIATVTVNFFFEGQTKDPTNKAVLLLEKQNNGQWLVANIYVFYEGQMQEGVIAETVNIKNAISTAPVKANSLEKPSQVEIIDGGSLTSDEKDMIFELAGALSASGKPCPSAFVFHGLNDKEGRKVFTIQGGGVYEDHFATHAWYQIDSTTGEVFEEDMVECALSPTGVKIPVPLQTQANQTVASPVLWVNDKDGLTLRNAPSRSAQKVVVMPHRSKVSVIDRNGPSETIIGITANWYKVWFNGQEGWCFSGLLADKEPKY